MSLERCGVGGRQLALAVFGRAPGQAIQQGAVLKAQRVDQLDVGIEPGNTFAALDLTDCSAVQPGPQAEVFLRQPGPLAGGSQVAAEPLRERSPRLQPVAAERCGVSGSRRCHGAG